MSLPGVERVLNDPETTGSKFRPILRCTFDLTAPSGVRKPTLLTMTKIALAERQKF